MDTAVSNVDSRFWSAAWQSDSLLASRVEKFRPMVFMAGHLVSMSNWCSPLHWLYAGACIYGVRWLLSEMVREEDKGQWCLLKWCPLKLLKFLCLLKCRYSSNAYDVHQPPRNSIRSIGGDLVLIMQFKVMVLEISNQLLESDAYGREEKGLAMHLPTTAYLYASLTAEITPHSSEVKIASSEWLLWVIRRENWNF